MKRDKVIQKHKLLTTSGVANLLKVSQQTAIRLMDSGVIRSWKVPMSTHRRTDIEEVRLYAERNGIKL